jgi:hypothetical protein
VQLLHRCLLFRGIEQSPGECTDDIKLTKRSRKLYNVHEDPVQHTEIIAPPNILLQDLTIDYDFIRTCYSNITSSHRNILQECLKEHFTILDILENRILFICGLFFNALNPKRLKTTEHRMIGF